MKNLFKLLILSIVLASGIVYASPSVSSGYIPPEINDNVIDKNVSNKIQLIFYRLDGNREFIPTIKVNDMVVGSLFPNNYAKTYACTKNIKIGVASRGEYIGSTLDEAIFLENSNLVFIKIIEQDNHKFVLKQVREDIAREEIKNFNLKSNIINRYNPKCELDKIQNKSEKEIALSSFVAVFFKTDSFNLTINNKEELDKFIRWVKEYKNIKTITIKSYADTRGSKKYNLALSQQRATSVKNYMEANNINIPLIIKNFGETSYFSKNCNSFKGLALDACLQEDRRVNININTDTGVING
ncbi:MAG: OmpA family protein [Sulfurovaceae bacterium]|nr:OmpA family protein [Sulfurovaceae bacterium]